MIAGPGRSVATDWGRMLHEGVSARGGLRMAPSWRTSNCDRARPSRWLRASVVLGAAIAALWLAGPASAVTATFLATGVQQKFVVPAGVTSVHLPAGRGAPGNRLRTRRRCGRDAPRSAGRPHSTLRARAA